MNNSRRGFTLIEVLFAMAILGIAFTVLIAATNQSVDMATRSKFITTSTLLAQKRIADVVSSNSALSTGTSEGDFGEDHQGYKYTEVIETTQLDGCNRYTLTVKWGEKNTLETQFTIFLSPK